jgi:hypothetical protein
MVFLIAILSHAGLVCFQESERFLPSSNYWNIMQELIVFKKFSTKIGATPSQIEAIKRIRASEEFGAMFRQEWMKSIKSKERVGNDSIYSKFDLEVKKELGKVLSAFQLDSLRKEWLKSKFIYGWSPLSSLEVLDFCNFDEDARQRLKVQISKESKILESQYEELTDSAISEVTKLLPVSARKPFVHYCGTKFFPNETLDPGFSVAIPFHNNSKFLSAMRHVATSPSMRKAVALTDEQVAKIQEMNGRYWSNAGKDSHETMMRDFEAASKEAVEVLSPEQRIKAFREISLFEFQRDCAAHFSTPSFVSFLGLSTTDAQALKLIAIAENDDLIKDLHELNKNLFNKLCDGLSEVNREKVKAIFDGVW